MSEQERRAFGRALAAGVAVIWAVLFFGLIDLSVPFPADPASEFFPFYVLETGWGILFTILVAAPLVALAIRPNQLALLSQQLVVALCVLIPAVLTPALGQLFPSLMLLGETAILAFFLRPWPPVLRIAIEWRRLRWALAVLVAVAVPPALAYAADMIAGSRQGLPTDITMGLDHGPMQAALPLAILGTALVAVTSYPGGRIAALCAATAAVWLGAISAAYPAHAASLGTGLGIRAIVWGILLVVLSELYAFWAFVRSRRGLRKYGST